MLSAFGKTCSTLLSLATDEPPIGTKSDPRRLLLLRETCMGHPRYSNGLCVCIYIHNVTCLAAVEIDKERVAKVLI